MRTLLNGTGASAATIGNIFFIFDMLYQISKSKNKRNNGNYKGAMEDHLQMQ